MPRDAASVLAKWQRGMQNAGAAYKQGIQNYQGNPMAVAASRLDLYAQNTAAAVTSGKMAAALGKVDVAFWKSQAMGPGAAALAAGAAKGAPKFNNFLGRAVPFWNQLSQQIQSMPKGTREAAVARQQAAMDAMRAFGGRPW